jgi:phage shock protein C
MRDGNRSSKVLVRPREGRMLGGVCAGIGEYSGLDVTMIRVLWAVVALMGGAGILAYIVAWILIPDEGQHSSLTSTDNLAGTRQDTSSR